jgi:hypothetical protein
MILVLLMGLDLATIVADDTLILTHLRT